MSQQWAWAYSAGLDHGRDIAIDKAGNVITINNGRGPYGMIQLPNDVGSVLSKHDSTGKLIWAVGMSFPYACGVTTDGSGNIYITSSSGNLTDKLYGVNSATTVNAPWGYRDGIVAKYDGNGEIIWAVTFGGANDEDEPRGIEADAMGNVYVMGISSTHNVNSTLISNCFIRKFNVNGILLWEKGSGWKHDVLPSDIAVDKYNAVYLTGSFSDSAVFDNVTLSSGVNSHAIFVAKYDPAGTLEWAQSKGSNVGFCDAISIDDHNNIYLSGRVFLPNTFDNVATVAPQTTAAVCMYLAKLDSAANTIWVATGDKVMPQDLDCNSDGDVFLTGSFGSSQGTFHSIPPVVVKSAKQAEIVVACYNSTGTIQWALAPAGNKGNSNWGSGIACDNQGKPWVIGSITAQTNFDSFFFTVTYSNAVVSDQFIAKIDTVLLQPPTNVPVLQLSTIGVYPTFTDRYFILDFNPAETCSVDYSVVNGMGQRIQVGTLVPGDAGTSQIDLIGNPPGLYFVQVRKKGSSFVTKIILH
jgi:hypothetical protein